MDSAAVKSLRLPTFDGTAEKFQIWWTRFWAYASVFAFAAALATGGEATLPAREDAVIDEATPAGVLSAAAKKRNAIAVAQLTMAFTSNGTMALVYEAVTDEWPSGLAHRIVAALKQKYQPQDTMTRVELRQRLNKS